MRQALKIHLRPEASGGSGFLEGKINFLVINFGRVQVKGLAVFVFEGNKKFCGVGLVRVFVPEEG